MAYDQKYGRVTMERGTVGENEPVVVFRARDRMLCPLLDHYESICRRAGSPQHHLDLIASTRQQIEMWQIANGDQIPRSDPPKE